MHLRTPWENAHALPSKVLTELETVEELHRMMRQIPAVVTQDGENLEE